MLDNIKNYKILLASKSPRRRELLAMMRIPLTAISTGGIKEEYPASLSPEEVPLYLSELKADAYSRHLNADELIITADTVVVCENRILGKPADEAEAIKMLRMLSGKTHRVISGVTISTVERRVSFSAITEVRFRHLSDEEISFYVECFQPLDKAGAYGIQEWIGGVAVESISGSFYNVMGLPVNRLYQELSKF